MDYLSILFFNLLSTDRLIVFVTRLDFGVNGLISLLKRNSFERCFIGMDEKYLLGVAGEELWFGGALSDLVLLKELPAFVVGSDLVFSFEKRL